MLYEVITNDPPAHQVVHGRQGFLQGRGRMPAVDVVNVKVVGLQTLEGALDFGHDDLARKPAGLAAAGRKVDFAGDDERNNFV